MVSALVGVMMLTGCMGAQERALPSRDVILIAHRGASGERPEHTLAAYELAIQQGADFIEPDLVATRDGILVARHENEISETTNVADRPEFAARRTTKTIDGQQVTGWFTEDFTLAELRTLRARERLPRLRPENVAYNDTLAIPTFAEVIALARARGVGVYPETKHPSYFRSIGIPLEEPLLADLAAAGWTRRSDPVFIQSFEVDNLKALRARSDLALVQLISNDGAPVDGAAASYAQMATPEGLRAIAAYADGVGPNKALLTKQLVDAAHAVGLKVHPWTYRAENYFLPARYWRGVNPRAHGDLTGEIRAAVALGVDGLFADHPAIAAQAIGKRPAGE